MYLFRSTYLYYLHEYTGTELTRPTYRIFTVCTTIQALNCLDHRIFIATHGYIGTELSRSSYLYCHARLYRDWIVLINVSLLSTPHAFKCTWFDQHIFTIYTTIQALNCLDHRVFISTHDYTGTELSLSTYLYCPYEYTSTEFSRSRLSMQIYSCI